MTTTADRRPAIGYALGLACTFGQVAWSWHIGPQPKGEHAPPSMAVWIANQLGFWALAWLVATLACTPLRWWTGATWPGLWRKRLGLTAFALALLHVGVWVVGERAGDLARIMDDVTSQPWMMLGLFAFALVCTLAATSPTDIARRLGGVRWRRVHRLVYVAAVAACLHYALRDGADPQHWIGFSLALTGLLWARWARSAKAAAR
ncbi:MAG: ferric reductase-like transmembrane domain-containing protein [Deltaproteobacteria bacterium]|nr:ferric reductase-like transmembrane domain-containing protein [Deltaproteobacteria bacterium]